MTKNILDASAIGAHAPVCPCCGSRTVVDMYRTVGPYVDARLGCGVYGTVVRDCGQFAHSGVWRWRTDMCAVFARIHHAATEVAAEARRCRPSSLSTARTTFLLGRVERALWAGLDAEAESDLAEMRRINVIDQDPAVRQ